MQAGPAFPILIMLYLYCIFLISKSVLDKFGTQYFGSQIAKAQNFFQILFFRVGDISKEEKQVEFLKDLKCNLKQDDIKWILKNEQFTDTKFNYKCNASETFLDDLRLQQMKDVNTSLDPEVMAQLDKKKIQGIVSYSVLNNSKYYNAFQYLTDLTEGVDSGGAKIDHYI